MKIYAYIPAKKKTVLLNSSRLVKFLKNNFKGVSFMLSEIDNRRRFIKAQLAENILPNIADITSFHRQLVK